jgi:hypothetical protein
MPVITIGTVGPLPDNAGSRVTATVGGSAWNGATAQALHTTIGTSVLVLGGMNTVGNVSIALSGATGPGTYTLSSNPTQMLTYMELPSTNSWGGGTDAMGATLDVGSVVITSWTSARVKGTFSAELKPTPGTAAVGTLVISGEFDIGFP